MKTGQATLSPEEEAQREDEQALAQTDRDIEDILELIENRTDRAEAERQVAEAQARVDERHQGTTFHHHTGGRRIPVRKHVSNLFRLSEALSLSMRTRRHGEDLHKSLDAHVRQRVRILQRMLKRGLYAKS